MLRRLIFALALLVLLPLTSAATHVTMSVEPWQTYDGNFGYSVIHAPGGAIQYEFPSPTQYLTGDLTGSVLTLDAGSLSLSGGSIFHVQYSVLDFGVAKLVPDALAVDLRDALDDDGTRVFPDDGDGIVLDPDATGDDGSDDEIEFGGPALVSGIALIERPRSGSARQHQGENDTGQDAL